METRENKYVHPGEIRMAKALIEQIDKKAEDGLSPVSLPSCWSRFCGKRYETIDRMKTREKSKM